MAFREITSFIEEELIIDMLRDKLEANTVAKQVVQVIPNSIVGKAASYDVPGITNLAVNQYDSSVDLVNQQGVTSKINIAVDKYPVVPYQLQLSDLDESKITNTFGAFLNEAGERIAQDIDIDILGDIFANGTPGTDLGVTTAPIALTNVDEMADYVETFATELAEANVTTDTVIVVPSFVARKLSRYYSEKVQNDSLAGSIVPGYITTIYGIDVYESNNLPAGVAGGLAAGEYAVVGGKRSCYHYIEGLTVMEEKSNPVGLSRIVHVAQVYGRGFSQTLGWKTGVVSKA